MNAQLLAAAISVGDKDGVIHQLFTFLIIGICVGLVYAAGIWFLKRPSIPAVARTIWDGLFILIGLVVILNFLLGFSGNQFIRW